MRRALAIVAGALILAVIAVGDTAQAAVASERVPAPPKGLRAVLTAGGYQYVGGHRNKYDGRPTLDYFARTRDHRRARFALGTGRGPLYVLGAAIGFKAVGPVREAVERELGMKIVRVSTWGSYVVLHLAKK